MDHEEGKGDGGALGRELLGGNGIVTDFHVGKAFCDMETVYTYEGSYDVNALIVAREITGISSIRPTSSPGPFKNMYICFVMGTSEM